MRCDFIGPESELWSRFLTDSPHDFYHLPNYVALSARDRLSAPSADGQPLAFHAEDDAGHRFLLTLIIRPLPDSIESSRPLFDAVTPYGYASPLVINQDDSPVEPFLDQALEAMRLGLRERGIVTVFARSHPTIPFPHAPLQKAGYLVHHGQTICMDLTLPTEELWHQTRAGHRSEINRSRKKGLTGEMQPDWKEMEEFYRAYTETMKRVGAGEHYYFPRAYFDELKQAVGDVLQLYVCYIEGKVACAALFSEVCGIVQYHLSGTTEEFHRQYPNKAMLDSVRTWAKERGNTVMHLGGGYGGSEDSLFQFKAGFSHVRAPFYTWRMIADQELYTQLCQQWEAKTGKTASTPEAFFPAYRAP